jgi:hypothetical protein
VVFMKKYLLLLVVACSMIFSAADMSAKKSLLYDTQNPFFGPNGSSFPANADSDPFDDEDRAQLPYSTGYYFCDSKDVIGAPWAPSQVYTVDTSYQQNLWYRILPGPNIRPEQYWLDHPEQGRRYFRNPGDMDDSTDDAFAGPIPIGFEFFFNGIRYDSFYVSTNGLITLTNRRYIYDDNGDRAVPLGADHCYDIMSMDWFAEDHGQTARTTERNNHILTPSDNGLLDPTPDDFGYNVSQQALLNPGIASLAAMPSGAAVIAPFYGQLQLSQYDPTTELPRDFGRAYYKRTMGGDSLIIYFVNASLHGTQTIYLGYFTTGPAATDGDPSYIGSIAAQAQIILVRTDSSVAIHYERFDGGLDGGNGGRVSKADAVYRFNTTSGVRGYARHTDFDTKTGLQTTPWAAEYEQYTHYHNKYRHPGVEFPGNKSTVKFKQWKNTLRVVGIKYMIRNRTIGYEDFDSLITAGNVLDYEFLAGHEQLGPVQPVAIIQNLTNDRQGPNGVNFHRQDLNFRARFIITNQATQKTIYNKIINIDSSCVAADDEIDAINCANNKYVRVNHVNILSQSQLTTSLKSDPWPGIDAWNGIPPYNFVEIFFPPFVPQEYFTNHIGRMSAVIAADPTDPRYNEPLGDRWPFDDSTGTRFFVMRRWNTRDFGDFRDDVSEFHVIYGVPMPSVLKWVNIGAVVVNGDETTHTPLPPLGPQEAANGELYGGFPVSSPVIFMDRMDGAADWTAITGNQYAGDEIRSYPIDLTQSKGAVLSVSVARFTKRDDWARGWNDEALIGPEHRAVVNNTWYSLYNVTAAASRYPDELDVEFAYPSANSNSFQPHDKMNNITNLPPISWRTLLDIDEDGKVEDFKPSHPYGNGSDMGGMAAYAIYGGGGYLRGFMEGTQPEEYNNALSYPKLSAPPALNGLVPNVYDDGVDYEFNKVIVPIPDAYFDYAGEGAYNFRMRIKVYASNDKKCMLCIADDNDPFYVDNIRIITPQDENVDVEVSSVKIKWPYTLTPASQATKLPIVVKINNNTSVHSPDSWVKVRIFNADVQGDLAPWVYTANGIDPVYCATMSIPSLPATELRAINMPEWNARIQPPGRYKVIANVYIPAVGFDLEPKNDTTYSYFELKYGGVFAYDPIQDENDLSKGRNDVDQFLSGTPGRGLNLYGYNMGGSPTGTTYNTEFWSAGYVGGSGSGSIAMKFELVQKDTLYGFQALYGPLSQAREQTISLSIYTGSNSSGLPSALVPGTEVYRYRAYDDIEEDYFFNKYVTHLLDDKIVLDKGIYWVVISQLEESGLELGATASRMGMRVMSIGIPPAATDATFGRGGTQVLMDKNLRKSSTSGNSLNNNIFAYANTKSLGAWVGFMITAENPAYAHLHHTGAGVDPSTRTMSRGTWLPLIRPYLKERSHGEEIVTTKCTDNPPVELTSFYGDARDASIDLFWVTASETTNEGFYVDRRMVSESSESDWVTLGFVKGNGTTERESRYAFQDQDVLPGQTYEYRLQQIDINGDQGCAQYIGKILVTFVGEGIAISKVYPNPIAFDTQISYFMAQDGLVNFEVIDVFGNVVSSWNKNANVNANSEKWDATNANGQKLTSGRYTLRITSGGQSATTPLTIVR